MSITAIVENDTIKLPMHVADGTAVEITLRPSDSQSAEKSEDDVQEGRSFYDDFKEFVGSIQGPPDLAAEHDHYAHGTPKRFS